MNVGQPAYQLETADSLNLRTLAICYYVAGGLFALTSCFLLPFLLVGLAMSFGAGSQADKAGGFIFMGVAVLIGLLIVGFAAAVAIVGRCLLRRIGYIYIQVMAALLCLWTPLGTVLGVFTFVVLSRPPVKAMFFPSDTPPLIEGR